jgi:hypothetical protein
VLLAGGVADPAGSTWEIFSTSSASFGRPSDSAELLSPLRSQHAAALMRDGRVLLAGGTQDGKTALATTEVFDPNTNRFVTGLDLRTPRSGAASVYAQAQDLLFLTGGAPKLQAPELLTTP